MAIRRKYIRRVVDDVLHTNGVVDPPVPVDDIARRYKIRIKSQTFEGDISGYLFRRSGNVTIGVNQNHSLLRRRFTIAHELGHFLLHPEGVDEVHVDRRFVIKLRSDQSSLGTNEHEVEANLFAAELLMPTELIRRDLFQQHSVDLIEDDVATKLAQRYKVSEQAMLFRLANLGHISI